MCKSEKGGYFNTIYEWINKINSIIISTRTIYYRDLEKTERRFALCRLAKLSCDPTVPWLNEVASCVLVLCESSWASWALVRRYLIFEGKKNEREIIRKGKDNNNKKKNPTL